MSEIKCTTIEKIGIIRQGANGWNKELRLVSWNDADPKTLQKLPNKYNNGKLRWLMSPKRAQEWELYLMNQVIGKGGAVPENVYTQPVHIPTVSCPSISDDKIVLTDPKNLVVVNTYGMKIRKTNEGKEAIILWNCNADGLCHHSNRHLHCCTRFPLLFRS